MGSLPRIFCRKQVRNDIEERDCVLSAKGWLCGFCRVTPIKPEGRATCTNCKATAHVEIDGRELYRIEKPKKEGMND